MQTKKNQSSTFPAAQTVNDDWSDAILTPGGGVEATLKALKRVRGKNKRPTKEQIAIRLDPDILEAFRAGGSGWQSRVNAALREWLATH